MHRGRKCPAPTGWLRAGPGDAPKGALPGHGRGATAIFLVSFRVGKMLLSVNVCLEMPSFQCIGGGSVPPPISCRTLGRAARRKARRLALAEA